MAEIIWSASALADLKSIFEFIARDSPYYAEKFVNRLYQKVDQLSQFLLRGKAVPELKDPEIREIIEGSYRIIYRALADESVVEIIRIHHSSRLLKK